MEKDGRSLKQMSHEMPFKNLIWKFSWEVGNFRGKLGIFSSKPYLRNSHKLLVKHSIQTSWLSLLAKTPRKHFYHTKSTWKTLENMGDTNHFQKQIKRTKLFFILSTYGWAQTSHLNKYKYTNEIGIRWTLDLCVMCVD